MSSVALCCLVFSPEFYMQTPRFSPNARRFVLMLPLPWRPWFPEIRLIQVRVVIRAEPYPGKSPLISLARGKCWSQKSQTYSICLSTYATQLGPLKTARLWAGEMAHRAKALLPSLDAWVQFPGSTQKRGLTRAGRPLPPHMHTGTLNRRKKCF